MKLARNCFWILAVAVAMMLFGASGCSKKSTDPDEDGEDIVIGGGGAAKVGKTEFKVPAFDGILKGKVTFKGELPSFNPPKGLLELPDCKEGGSARERQEQAWLIDPATRAVENVVISIAIPRNQYFELPPHARERKDTVVIDQPHCAFMPHVQALYPEYYDGKEQKFKPTGQKFVIKNGARFGHNFNVAGDVNPPQNISLAPGSEKELDIKFEKRGFIIKTSCNIHSFMYGSIHTFDHPFFVVTRENGEFEISGLPTGVEVTVKAWHEVPQYFENKKMTLQPGVNRLDLEVSK